MIGEKPNQKRNQQIRTYFPLKVEITAGKMKLKSIWKKSQPKKPSFTKTAKKHRAGE
jgi:hypothetical protein